MKSLQDEMQSMKKASEMEVDKTSASLSKAGPSKQPDPTTTRTSHPTRASDHSDAQPMDSDIWSSTSSKIHLKVSSPTLLPNTRILNPTITRILIPRTTRLNLKGCVQKQRSTRTRKNTRGSAQVLFTVVFRGRSVLYPY